MSLLFPVHPVTVNSRAHRIPRAPLSNTLLYSTSSPSHRRQRLPTAMCFKKSFDSSFKLHIPLPFLALSAGFVCFRNFLRILPSDFSDRWTHLAESSQGSEKKVKTLPYHLIQAVLASEDHRFFYHIGFDPFGIGRAVVYYPNGGGGSTITQQLVKNIFLTSERTISRKFVEGILSIILERRFSKWEILYAYLTKMYWGHGNYGIEAASHFYFRKHPSLLNVGESALLAGILPGPEVLNPITNPKKSKDSQARALRRMVAAGFLDLETALRIVTQPLSICNYGDAEEIKNKFVQ